MAVPPVHVSPSSRANNLPVVCVCHILISSGLTAQLWQRGLSGYTRVLCSLLRLSSSKSGSKGGNAYQNGLGGLALVFKPDLYSSMASVICDRTFQPIACSYPVSSTVYLTCLSSPCTPDALQDCHWTSFSAVSCCSKGND